MFVGLHHVQLAMPPGQDVTSDADFPGFRRCYAADPFGNRLEFLEPAATGR